MPLNDLFKFHDPALADEFNVKPYDASKDRKAFNKSLNAALDQLENGRTKVPNRMWSVANKIVEFKPTFKGRPVEIMGETTFYIPQEQFAQAIATIKASVEAGELDDVLEGSEGQGASRVTPARASKPSKRGTGLGNVAKPDDAEWMALFVEVFGPAPEEGMVPNSTATKWVSAKNAARGSKARAARK